MNFSTIAFYISQFLVFLTAFCAPFLTLIHAIVFLVVVDLITAIILQTKTKNGFLNKVKVVQSKKMRKSVIKLFLYILFIVSTYVLVEAILPGGLVSMWVMKITFFSLAVVEITSISANMNNITGETIFTKTIKKIINVITDTINKGFN